ncbi:MAG TPA: hypothetical protein VKU93_02625 [Terracidiphilus sp.]|nr:hypothetical protein [Terracidiphilus sp.]
MAVTFVNWNGTTGFNANTLTFGMPSGTQPGDTLVVLLREHVASWTVKRTVTFSPGSISDTFGNNYIPVIFSYGTFTASWAWVCLGTVGDSSGSITVTGPCDPGGGTQESAGDVSAFRGVGGYGVDAAAAYPMGAAGGGTFYTPTLTTTSLNDLLIAYSYAMDLSVNVTANPQHPTLVYTLDSIWDPIVAYATGGVGINQNVDVWAAVTSTNGKYNAQINLSGGSGTDADWQLGLIALRASPQLPPPPPEVLPYLIIPSGESQTVNELDGHSSVGQIDAEAIDPTGDLRALAATPGTAGLTARVCLGFPNMNLQAFQTLHTMQLLSMDRSPEGLIRFHLADPQRFLMKQVWTSGGPSAWQPGDDTPPPPTTTAFMFNGWPVSDKNPRYVQGNPIDILLVACQNELGLGQDPSLPPNLWRMYSPGRDSTLINPNPWLDIPGALALRDGQFSGVRFEFKITSAQDGKQWIEDQILKPLGLYWVVRANGQLSLKSMKQPVSVSPFALNDDNIIGTPDTERWPIVNVLRVTPGTDDSRPIPIELVDAASNAVFNQQYEQDVQADGLRYGWGAFLIAGLLADKVFRRHASNTPVYSIQAFLAAVKVEVGDFVTLTHRLMLDLETGAIGVSNVLCEVIDRNPDYSQGRVVLKVADTRFMKFNTPAQIAPSGTPAWGSATAAQRAQYMFIASSSGLNPDGSAANVIF